mgnify:CR=1 FL=1
MTKKRKRTKPKMTDRERLERKARKALEVVGKDTRSGEIEIVTYKMDFSQAKSIDQIAGIVRDEPKKQIKTRVQNNE